MRSVLSVPSRYCALWVLEGTASWGEGQSQRASSTARSPGALGPGIAPRPAGRDSHPLQRGGPQAPPPHAVALPPRGARRPGVRGSARTARGDEGGRAPDPSLAPGRPGTRGNGAPPGAVPRRSHGVLAAAPRGGRRRGPRRGASGAGRPRRRARAAVQRRSSVDVRGRWHVPMRRRARTPGGTGRVRPFGPGPSQGQRGGDVRDPASPLGRAAPAPQKRGTSWRTGGDGSCHRG